MKRARSSRSVVWQYFNKSGANLSKAICTVCGETLKHSNNTSNLFKHLKCKHFQVYEQVEEERKEEEAASSRAKRPATRQQLTMESTFTRSSPYPHSSVRWKEATDAVVRMIVKDMQPLSVVENEGFRRLMQVMDPRYQLPSRSTITRSLLPQKYEALKQTVKVELTQVKYVALTTDLWTSNQTLGYITVTFHYISHEWELHSRVLDTLNLDKDHTAANLAEELQKIAVEWGVDGKISCIITDNASNIVAAINQLGWRHLPCFAHTLNLVVRDSIQGDDEVSRLQQKCKQIVTFFHHSTKATEKLLSIQQQTGSEVKNLKLKQDVETRWNSTFYMMERLHQLNEVVTTTLCLLGKNHLCLSPSDCEVIVQIVSLLKPCEKATQEMSGDSFVSVSKLIPLVHLLQGALYSGSDSIPGELKLQMELKQQMKWRFAQIESNYILAAPTILDPRFKKVAFCHLETAERTVERISGELCGLTASSEEPSISAYSNSADSPAPSPASELWRAFDKKVAEASSLRSTSDESTVDIRRYLQERNIPRNDDPLAWWKEHATHYPHLQQLAMKYLCIPATSVPAERLFSKAGELISKRRSCLKPKNVNMLPFLNKNL